MVKIISIAIPLMYLSVSLFFFAKLAMKADKNSKWLAISTILSLIAVMLASIN